MKMLPLMLVGMVMAHLVGTPIHEFGHWAAAHLLGYHAVWAAWGKIVVPPLMGWHLVIVALAGPLAAVIAGSTILKVGGKCDYARFTGAAIIILNGLLNLLPIAGLDGTRAYSALNLREVLCHLHEISLFWLS